MPIDKELQPVRRGWGFLPCPLCGESAVISIDLNDLTTDEACECRQCDKTFGLDTIRDIVAKWEPVIRWLETAPEVKK